MALYRTDSGKLGLVAQRCAHRGASLAYGIPEEEGLRCPYHGWRYDHTGQCNEQPAEPADSTFKDRIKIPVIPFRSLVASSGLTLVLSRYRCCRVGTCWWEMTLCAALV